MSDQTPIVTGDAVVLELRLAKLASRSLALAIDVALQLGLVVAGTLALAGVVSFVDNALAAAIGLAFYIAVVIGYPVAFETATRGRTLGKMALGLRVVREDGGPIRFRHAFVRGLLGVVEIWLTFGSVALITSLASAKGKRLGDYLAGTVAVRERMPVQSAPMAAMPPPLAGWAPALDLSRVPDDLALAARQYLSRYGELAPEVRAGMGQRLATAVAALTTPPPPPGTPAWAFLSAVLAERRRRDLSRLSGADQGWGHQPPPVLQAPPPTQARPPTPSPADGPQAPVAPPVGDGFAPPG